MSPREAVLLIPGGNPRMAAADRLPNTQVAARVTLFFSPKPDREFTESPGWDQLPSPSGAIIVGTVTQSR